MRRKAIITLAAAAVLGLTELAATSVVQAGMFDMMNPSRWFGNDRNNRYGYGGPYGRYGGPYGGGYGGPYGWGGPYGGYGPGGWGGPYGGGPWGGGYGYPGYGRGSTIVVNPPASPSSSPASVAPKLPE